MATRRDSLRYRLGGIVLTALFACAWAGPVYAYDPTVDDLAAVLWRYNETAPQALPIPSRQQLEQIVRGETIDIRERQPAGTAADGTAHDLIRVVGFQYVAQPRLLVWLATLNVQAGHSPRLIEHLVDGDDAGGSLWYQHLNTPWPVRNRHWVIRNTKSVDLADKTHGLVWEHSWQLEPTGRAMATALLRHGKVRGLGVKDDARAIYLATNRGAWTMFAISDDATLVVAHTTADMGGWIPDSWVASFVSRQLGHVLQNLDRRTQRIDQDYTGDYLIFGGDGKPISTKMAREAARAHRRQHELQPAATSGSNSD